ncbi:MAG: hypothetical protein ACM3NH_01025 [Candidatus Saccharibacteria bacterium]
MKKMYLKSPRISGRRPGRGNADLQKRAAPQAEPDQRHNPGGDRLSRLLLSDNPFRGIIR